jgi:predicted TIM-barrel fold metal-dependent hydrolase
LEKTRDLGIKNVHVHKGPTIRPLNKDAFDVGDVDEAATAFTDLNFIIEHVGIPRFEDFCYIAAQEPNVYGGLAVLSALIHKRPHFFAEVLGELLFWLGADRILYGSDYAIWSPKWIVEELMNFELPADVSAETGQTLTLDVRRKIMGENAARLYGIDIAERCKKLGLPVPEKAESAVAAA